MSPEPFSAGSTASTAYPTAVTEQLAAVREHSARRHLLYAAALGQIARAFDSSDLSWVAMKGPVIALRYPDVGDRTYNDLDMLVDRRDFPHAVSILEDLGYRHATHDWALAEQMLAGELSMSKQAVPVDLHWHLHYSHHDRRPIAIDPEEMIERSRSIAISGTRTSTFDAVDTLLTLAFHAARSDGHRLIWLKDIEREVAAEQPDFDELIRRCREYRCARPVGLMLHRAHVVLGAEVPDEVIRALAHTALADRRSGRACDLRAGPAARANDPDPRVHPIRAILDVGERRGGSDAWRFGDCVV